MFHVKVSPLKSIDSMSMPDPLTFGKIDSLYLLDSTCLTYLLYILSAFGVPGPFVLPACKNIAAHAPS